MIIGFIIGIIIGSTLCAYLDARFFNSDTGQRNDRFAKKLSTDKPPERFGNTDYIIYANGTRWLFCCWVDWELFWIPENGDESWRENKDYRHCEFKATWPPDRRKLNMIKWIILNHPNMKYRDKLKRVA